MILSVAQIDIMADLDEVINFGAAANSSGFEPCAVDRRIGAYFDIIFNDDDAKLFEFSMSSFCVGRESETARADDGAGLQNDAIADAAFFADSHMGMEMALAADADAGANGRHARRFLFDRQ